MRLRVALIVGLVVARGLFSVPRTPTRRGRRSPSSASRPATRATRARAERSAALAKTLTGELRARAAEPATSSPGRRKDLLELKLLSDCLDENAICMVGDRPRARRRRARVRPPREAAERLHRVAVSASTWRPAPRDRSTRPGPPPPTTAMRKVASAIALGPPAEPAAPVVAAALPEPASSSSRPTSPRAFA